MSDFFAITLPEVLSVFHFIRPWVLVILPAVALLWWRVRLAARYRDPGGKEIAPHLQKALTIGEGGGRQIVPIDAVALALVLTGLAAAGPTWSRMPDPFVSPTAPVVIVLKNTSSMEEPDVAPSRLERSKFKIRDLLDIRAGARTALVTYAGTAHRVLPFTEDARIVLPYLEGLTPEVMPQDGANASAALALAVELLATEDVPGGILFVLDDLDPADADMVTEAAGNAVVFHQILPGGQRSRGLDQIQGVPVIPVTPDDADLRQIDRTLNAAYRAAVLDTSTQPWQDRGWIAAIPTGLICLFWFRRGWTMNWAAMLFFCLLSSVHPHATKAEGLADWFLTSDQQGQLAYNGRDFARAGELYDDPLRRGFALYRAGQYEKAVEVLTPVETAQAAFIQGVAHLRNRQYRDGVRAFETALERDADFPGATENLATAQEIVEFVETQREQSDTGEDSGIGADETVYDNESARGLETELAPEPLDGAGLLTTEQWMNTVDTRTGDFLRQRFLIEASRTEKEK
ncbi:MAG: VWA domain-containing protein [Pseudomonadota bacterium]